MAIFIISVMANIQDDQQHVQVQYWTKINGIQFWNNCVFLIFKNSDAKKEEIFHCLIIK